MAQRGVAFYARYTAVNTATNAGQTGDAGNHTLVWDQDGSPVTPANAPQEVAGMAGTYRVLITAAEADADSGTLGGSSSTANVVIIPSHYTFEPGDTYHAAIEMTVDTDNSQDEYTVVWFKNGVRVTSGIASPSIQVIRRSDGSDLVAPIGLSEIGSSGSYKHDEAANRVSAGEAALAIVTATIDGETRSFACVISIDGPDSTGDVYHADIDMTVDEANTRDEYTVTWFKNGDVVTSGITSPLIRVAKRSDGTDLIASTAMTQIGVTGSHKHDEATNRTSAGEAVIVIATATIDGQTRTYSRNVSRDSTA